MKPTQFGFSQTSRVWIMYIDLSGEKMECGQLTFTFLICEISLIHILKYRVLSWKSWVIGSIISSRAILVKSDFRALNFKTTLIYKYLNDTYWSDHVPIGVGSFAHTLDGPVSTPRYMECGYCEREFGPVSAALSRCTRVRTGCGSSRSNKWTNEAYFYSVAHSQQ